MDSLTYSWRVEGLFSHRDVLLRAPFWKQSSILFSIEVQAENTIVLKQFFRSHFSVVSGCFHEVTAGVPGLTEKNNDKAK